MVRAATRIVQCHCAAGDQVSHMTRGDVACPVYFSRARKERDVFFASLAVVSSAVTHEGPVLQMCQEDDVRLFTFLLPDIYTQFANIAVGNAELLHLIVSSIDGTQVCQRPLRRNVQ